MKTIVIHGSPHKNGNSSTLAEYFLHGLGSHDVRHFFPNEMNIRPCQGCEDCQSHLEHYCSTEDDMQLIYSAFIEADLIVFATPMYWGYMTAQLKAIIDRMEAITDHFQGKTFVVLITYRYHCASTVAFFERICPTFKVSLHTICCRTMDEQENDIPISRMPEKLHEAEALGQNLRRGG